MDFINMMIKSMVAVLFLILNACSGGGSSGEIQKTPGVGAFGTSNGGGGKGVQCGNSLMVLDLYEASLNGKPLLKAYPTYSENVANYGAALGNFLNDPSGIPITGEIVLQALKENFEPKIRYIPAGERLPATEDASLPGIPSDCQFVQIAIWEKNNEIRIDRDLWDRLSPQHQAALALHEIIYMADRENGAKTSDESRFVIADIFTNSAPRARMGPFLNNTDRVLCVAGGGDSETPTFEFFAYGEERNSVRGVGFYFRSVADNYMMTLTESFVPDMRTGDILEPRLEVKTKIVNVASSRVWNLEIYSYEDRKIIMRAWRDGEALPRMSQGFSYRD